MYPGTWTPGLDVSDCEVGMTERPELREEIDILDRMLESQLDQLEKLVRAQEEKLAAIKREMGALRGIHELRKRKQASLDKLDNAFFTEGIDVSR
jgi:hypothetical protein